VEALVDRFIHDDHSTVSEIFIDLDRECLGLEDEPREVKVAGKTRIPAGRYKVGVRTVGGFHARYAARFPEFHQGMLQVLDVPEFEYILLHCGNTHEDTAGCLLTGGFNSITTHNKMRMIGSAKAYRKLYQKLIAAALAGELWITYVDNDRR
jgi:hypothetical protein